MPPITTVTRASQIGLESTPGTVVPAGRLYHGLSLALAPSGDFQTYGPQGYKVDTGAYPLTEFVAGQFSGEGDFQSLAVGLASAINNPAPVRNIPTTGLSYTRTFALNPRGPDTYATYTAEIGDSNLARRAAFVFANGIEIEFGRRQFRWSAPAIGRAFATGITLTATPTEIPMIPMVPRLSDVFLDSTFAALGTTKLLSNFSGRFRLTDRRATKWPQNSSLSSFSDAYELKPTIELMLQLEADAVSDTLIAPMQAGDTRYVRVEYTGPLIETGFSYRFRMDFAVKIAQVPTYDDQDGLQVSPWTFRPVSDANLGGAFSFSLINTVATL